MEKKVKTAITPSRAEDYPEWYQQVIKASDLAERSPVRGCMVIRPWGYALWENIVRELDDMFKATDVKNAYFPLFIPISFLEKKRFQQWSGARRSAQRTFSCAPDL
jgi:prolyl-tRNA synthetase